MTVPQASKSSLNLNKRAILIILHKFVAFLVESKTNILFNFISLANFIRDISLKLFKINFKLNSNTLPFFQLNLGNGLVFLALLGGCAPLLDINSDGWEKLFVMMLHGPEMRI